MMEITYLSDCDIDYVKAVKKCKTLDELRTVVEDYREIAEDAYQAVQTMDEILFVQFCKGRNKQKPSMEWMKMYGMILLPKTLLEVGLVASAFNVPFGLAYHRMKDLGKLSSSDKKVPS